MTQQTRATFISTVDSTLTDGGENTAAEVRTILGNDIDSCFVILTDDSDDITEGAANLFLTTAERTILGNTSGTNTGDQTTVTGNAGTVTVVDAAEDATTWVLLGTAQTGSLSPATDAGITYNGTTNALTATTFIGALTGDVTGNVSGSSGSTTGNAATATALETARTINGESFNGTANITVTAAAGTLTGTALNATVVTSSLTSVGTVGTGTWQGTAVGAVYGGTAQTSYASGDMLYASASNTLAKRTIGNTDDVLMVSGGLPTWTSITTVRQIPQNSQSTAYTTVLADGGKHILHPSADTTARVFTIDSNANVAYPIGTAITFVNQDSAGVVTISITSDTMRLAGAGTTGSRTLAANGIATALKITSTEWIISGTGLT